MEGLSGHWLRPPEDHDTLTSEFIRRFLIHVLPQGFHRIRHYGLLASGTRADNIARARELLAVSNSQAEPTSAAVDPSKPTCPCCGGRMIVIETLLPILYLKGISTGDFSETLAQKRTARSSHSRLSNHRLTTETP